MGFPSNSDRCKFIVAIVGPDGAGKTTACLEVESQLPVPCRYIYMGNNREASKHTLITTRLYRAMKGRMERASASKPVGADVPGHTAAHSSGRTLSPDGLRRAAGGVKSFLGVCNRACEEWYRLRIAGRYLRQDDIVLFDRHFLTDFWANEPQNSAASPLARRFHGFLLERMRPKPDIVIYLDAPADVLFGRKGEGTIQSLELQRQGYLALGQKLQPFHVVDGTQPLDQVIHVVLGYIMEYYECRSGKKNLVCK